MVWSAVDDEFSVDTRHYVAPPLPRAGMTMARHRDRLFVFGGSGPSAKCYDDLHVYDPQRHQWVETVTVVAAESPDEQRHQWRRSSRSGRSRARSQPRWDIYEDDDQQDGSWSGGDAGEFDDELDSDEEFEDAHSDGEAMIVARDLANDSCDSANPNEMCEFTDVDVPKREEPLLVARESQIIVPDVRYGVFLLLLEYLYTGHIETHDDAFAVCSRAHEADHEMDFVSNSIAACPQSADGLNEIEEARCREPQRAQSYDMGLEMELESLLELLVAADQFMLDHLKQRCERALQYAVRIGSVETISDAADRANAVQLQAVCRHFLRNHTLPPSSPVISNDCNDCGSFDGGDDDDPNLNEMKPQPPSDEDVDEAISRLSRAALL
ncbi:unnamed protein product [Phytophthora fragariaefolia]|uniref:Unnamed protein product n=1 Tax=Phytophthora fragariaefolia TaxID=1490495 RepID=A0A9W7CZ32_9STRA|nr:unnamed protein product [Phytophthora fragariaefolia]